MVSRWPAENCLLLDPAFLLTTGYWLLATYYCPYAAAAFLPAA